MRLGCAVERGDGTRAVLKLGMPHMEAIDEIQGPRFWACDPSVDCEADEDFDALLLERCEPGVVLRGSCRAGAGCRHRRAVGVCGRVPLHCYPFRPLSVMCKLAGGDVGPDLGEVGGRRLVQEGLRLFEDLPCSASTKMCCWPPILHAVATF